MSRRKRTRADVWGKGEYLGGTRVKYIWPCGHFRTEDLARKSLPVYKRIPTAEGVRITARNWSEGMYLEQCPTCKGSDHG
jgi:hypothetical protein